MGFKIAGYCRISVDDELDNDNISIENQKLIIQGYVDKYFPDSELDFYIDRDKSGYTFEERDGYQKMRKLLFSGAYDILIIKDFSRFSRRNSRGLCELEDLRDRGIRIISIQDNIDYIYTPYNGEWMHIQFRFLMNEMPVTDTSRKVKAVISRRQEEGKWLCSVPYGYIISDKKTQEIEIVESEAEVVRLIFKLYLDGWGYKKIANYLTENSIPTPRMGAKQRKESRGEDCRYKVKPSWSIVSVQGILDNDFYIGTLRQGKYTRKKINGKEIKRDESEHLLFENNHPAIIDTQTFLRVKTQREQRSLHHYRGVKKYDNFYSGLLECGDCGSPMFPMSRKNYPEAYRCGAYHQRGCKACSAHYIKAETIDNFLRIYLTDTLEATQSMIQQLQQSILNETKLVKQSKSDIESLREQLADLEDERAILLRRCAREIRKNPEKEDKINATYDVSLDAIDKQIEGVEAQIKILSEAKNNAVRVTRIATVAVNLFESILKKEKFDRGDLEILVERIYIYDGYIKVKLKSDIESILKSGSLSVVRGDAANFSEGIVNIASTEVVESVAKRPDKVYDVNVISNGDPLEIYTDGNGEVIFKKYSPIGELGSYTKQYVNVLGRTTGLPVAICDRDHIIAASGSQKKEIIGKRISPLVESYMERRGNYVYGESEEKIILSEEAPRPVSVLCPIIGGGDGMGAVVLLSDEKGVAPSQTEIKLAQVAAGFLGKQMEE